MEGRLTELSKYRFECACEDLRDAKILFEAKSFKSSVNRGYYAIFHALRAVTGLDGFDASKHSSVIAYINRNHSGQSEQRGGLPFHFRLSFIYVPLFVILF